MSFARQGIITPEMKFVANKENIDPEQLREKIAQGSVIIPANKNHLELGLQPMAIGKGTLVKINANIGASRVRADLTEELSKVDLCIKYGADTLMDLSTGGDIDKIRKEIIQHSPIPVGTVPIYQVVEENAGDIR